MTAVPAVHRVLPEEAGRRLDVVIAAWQDISRSRAAALVDDGLVKVDGRSRARSHRVVAGERLEVGEPAPRRPSPPPPLPPVVVEDDDFLVLDKPAGLVVHPGHGHPDGTLVDALRAAGLAPVGPDPDRPGIVHRLDKDTSGLLVVARTERGHRALAAAMRDRTATRGYLALVEGRLPGDHGRIDVPLGRDDQDRTRFAARADGRRAVTHFAVQAGGGAPTDPATTVTLVACRLETGRTHQIRVHVAHAGAPVVGDRTYGAAARTAAALGLDRMFLHATELRLPHPRTGVPVVARAGLPAALVRALERAGIDPAMARPEAVRWPPGT